ncbi:hypothetical protein ELI15_13975 [Rhizobium ruizarguesonis]|uniref:hypothetical protein n=1 Tax=Rhizobium ruizarguesonis TaxID=2081791 RepID=UPI0010321A53|nr:hypothetical protein [Rhizobium ruizarguesonis]TAW65397.1 hypothetical protein ELI15_13975 [Rhizobium ruizarguesonis]
MHEKFWTKPDFEALVRLYIDGRTTAEIARELGRTTQAVATKGSRIGLYGLTREELQEPGVAVRTCLNPVAPHLFVSTGKFNRTCSSCKQTQIFQAA